VLKVTLKDDAGVFIIDLAGAQCGFYEVLVPFQIYQERYVRKIKSIKAWGQTAAELYSFQCSYRGQSEIEIVTSRSVFRFVPEFTEAMNNKLNDLGYLGSVSVEAMDKILSVNTLDWQIRFLKHVESSIKTAARDADARSQARIVEEVQRFRRDKFQCPPWPRYGTGGESRQGTAGPNIYSVGQMDIPGGGMGDFEAMMEVLQKMGAIIPPNRSPQK